MKKSLPILLSSILIIGIHSWHAPTIHAQTSLEKTEVSIVVSPPRFDVEMTPGETVQKTIKVTNNAQTPLTLQIVTIDFIVQDDLGTPLKVNAQGSGRFLASPWFTPEENTVTIGAGEQKAVNILITAPEDALAGGHYAGVFFEPAPSREKQANVSYTAAQVGSLFALTVAGNIHYDALIQDFRTSKSTYEFGPIDFTTIIENQSDTHIRPQTSITVRDMMGRDVATIPLDELNIFPFATRTLQATWDITWGLGRYTAVVTATYGPGMTTQRSLVFWIMPWKIIASITIMILVSLSFIITIRRHIKHRSDTRDLEIDELKRKIVELENKQ